MKVLRPAVKSAAAYAFHAVFTLVIAIQKCFTQYDLDYGISISGEPIFNHKTAAQDVPLRLRHLCCNIQLK